MRLPFPCPEADDRIKALRGILFGIGLSQRRTETISKRLALRLPDTQHSMVL